MSIIYVCGFWDLDADYKGLPTLKEELLKRAEHSIIYNKQDMGTT